MTANNKQNLSFWLAQQMLQKVIWRRRSRRYWHQRRSKRMKIGTVCWVVLDTFIPTVFLCVGVLFTSGMSEQWLTTNKNSTFEYRPLE